MFGPIWEPFWTLFAVKNHPSYIKMASQTLSGSKMWIFTKPFKNQCEIKNNDPQRRPKMTKDRPKTAPRRSWRDAFFASIDCWMHFESSFNPNLVHKNSRAPPSPNLFRDLGKGSFFGCICYWLLVDIGPLLAPFRFILFPFCHYYYCFSTTLALYKAIKPCSWESPCLFPSLDILV